MAKKVWVLHGGNSAEREVSLKSGLAIEKALQAKGYQTKLFDVSPGKKLYELQWFDSSLSPDIVFLGLHGSFGEDGTIQGFLESIKIPFVGSGCYSSSICFNKESTKLVLQNSQVPVPHSFKITRSTSLETQLAQLAKEQPNFLQNKYFIKAVCQGSSIGAFPYEFTPNSDNFKNLTSLCRKALQFDQSVLLEEFIEGREMTCTIFKGKALPIVEIKPADNFYDYKSKYTSGQSSYIVPAQIPKAQSIKIQEASTLAFSLLECSDYARVDLIYQNDTSFKILEVNTLPGMTETSLAPKAAKAAGLDFPQFLSEIIEFSFNRQKESL